MCVEMFQVWNMLVLHEVSTSIPPIGGGGGGREIVSASVRLEPRVNQPIAILLRNRR